MLIVKVDVIDAQALERRLAGGANILGPAVNRALAIGQPLVDWYGRLLRA